MKNFALLALLAPLAVLAACSQANPTRPSPLAAESAGLLTQRASALSVDWAVLTSARDSGPGSAMPDAPTAPANLAFTVSGSTVILTWSAPSSANATSYVLEAGSSSGLSNLANFNTGSTATTITVTVVPAGTYYVRVRARNADGAGAASNEITIVVGQGPCSTLAVPALSASTSGNTITLSWSAVTSASSYVIDAGSASGASNLASFDTGSAATSFSATVLNGRYFIRVRARNACATSTPSNEVFVVISSGPTPRVAGRWVGSLTADADIINCPTTVSVDMNLTDNGSAVSGTAHTQITSVRFASCSDVLGFVADYGVTGSVAADGSISFVFGGAAYSFAGSVSGTSMTGRYSGSNGRGTFSFTK